MSVTRRHWRRSPSGDAGRTGTRTPTSAHGAGVRTLGVGTWRVHQLARMGGVGYGTMPRDMRFAGTFTTDDDSRRHLIFHGKEGVWGSSPQEGFAGNRCKMGPNEGLAKWQEHLVLGQMEALWKPAPRRPYWRCGPGGKHRHGPSLTGRDVLPDLS